MSWLVHVSQQLIVICTFYFFKQQRRERRESGKLKWFVTEKGKDDKIKIKKTEKWLTSTEEIKSLWNSPVSVENHSGWLTVTCVAIIESRSAWVIDCNSAVHPHSLIILNHTYLKSATTPVSSLSSGVHHSVAPPPAVLVGVLDILFSFCLKQREQRDTAF